MDKLIRTGNAYEHFDQGDFDLMDVYGVLGADDITLLNEQYGMIDPFIDYKVSTLSNGNKAISYGLTGAGYDIRVESMYKNILNVKHSGVIDPKNPDTQELIECDVIHDENGSYIIMEPHTAYKGVSYERFKMPTDIMGICMGKSTLARVDTVQHITPIEPGWEGYLTMEIVNISSYSVRFYLMEGVCQVLFLPVSCHTQYAGYYQYQQQRVYLATETPNV